MNIRFAFVVMLAGLLLTGCAGSPNKSHPMFEPVAPVEIPPVQMESNSGSIYQTSRNMSLFEDFRARRVGDIVTIILSESTNAAKSSDTSLDKSNSNVVTNPTLAGVARTLGSDSNLGFDLKSEHGFEGESKSNQSNSLQGSVAVTVAKVLPNGNLYVQGEKWIHINQGNEYIRLRGIVRPVDISANNSILSTQVADARISYGGTGATAEVNAVGWLSRFFISQLWPF